uniref:Uncharacterized protein n=1 Tax=Anguilla anguilla TaxID=7936 RepID=A0A0E9RUQ5_ANGAN
MSFSLISHFDLFSCFVVGIIISIE